jgi:hypothetical protein
MKSTIETKELVLEKKNWHLCVGHEKHYLNKGAGSRKKTGTFVWGMKSTI